MADILIRGMEMPEDCDMIVIYSDGTVRKYLSYTKVIIDEAEAVSIPLHGRLIDARYIRDAIIQKWMDKAGDSHMYKCGMEDAYEVIRNAPTIIPASEGRT